LSGFVFAQKYDPLTGEEIKIKKFDPLTGDAIEENKPDIKNPINDKKDVSTNTEDSNNQLQTVKTIPQSMVGEPIKLTFVNDIELFGKITAQNRNYISIDIEFVGEAIIPLKNIKSFNQVSNTNTSYRLSSKPSSVENSSNKVDILDFERSLDAELSQYVRKKSYPVLGIGGCALAPLTFGLSIPIIALYSYIPVTKVEPISKFYKDLPPQHKIKYKTEFNKKITAKKATGIQNGMLGSAALFFSFLLFLG
tara:strand:- start:703 stop:1455 length:753 start_codon:yes stop_codon:yes gene_type:complete